MTADIIQGHFQTTCDIPPERILDAAKEAGLDTVFVLGWKGDETYFAGSSADIGAALLLFELFKRDVVLA